MALVLDAFDTVGGGTRKPRDHAAAVPTQFENRKKERRMRVIPVFMLAVVASGLSLAAPVSAQPLGTFRWQLQPYCNVISVAVVQQGGQYQLDGTDNQCGAPQAASVRGLAFLNPNGSIGFGLTIVTAPGGTPVHVEATIAIATLNGTWRDSAGNSGTFIFTAGAGIPGGPRPVPSGGLAPASITNVQIANNAIGAAQVNAAQVQVRVNGSCPAGQAITAVNADGTVICAASAVDIQFRVVGHPLVAAPNLMTTPVGWSVTPQYNSGGGIFNAAAGTYTVPQAGLYQVTTTVRWAAFASATGYKCVGIRVNFSSIGTVACDAPSTTASFQVQGTASVMSLSAGDVVSIGAFQASGVAATLGIGGSGDTHFSVTRLR